MTIRMRLIAVLCTMSLLAILSVTTLFAAGSMLIVLERQHATQDLAVSAAVRDLGRSLFDQAAAVRLFILSGDEQALAPYVAGLEAENAALATIGSDGRLTEDAHRAASMVDDAIEAWRTTAAAPAIGAIRANLGSRALSASALEADAAGFLAVRAALTRLEEAVQTVAAAPVDEVSLLTSLRTVIFVGSIVGGLLALLVTIRALRSLVWQPLQSLVDTASRVEEGADVSFQLRRRDEVGDLAAALERMRHRINEARQASAADAAQSSIVNAFTEMSAFTESDVEIAEAMLTAVDQLVRPDASVAHVSNRSRDRATPVAETIGAFEELVAAGSIRAYGGSNVDTAWLEEALQHGRPAWVQNSFSLLDRGDETGVLPVVAREGLGYTPFSPLAGGWLTGKYRRGEEPPAGSRMRLRPEPYEHLQEERVYDALEAFAARARERETTPAALAIAWLLAHPHVTAVVVGPRRPEQLRPALEALELDLSPPEHEQLAALFG